MQCHGHVLINIKGFTFDLFLILIPCVGSEDVRVAAGVTANGKAHHF
jgi:hypothetical protein